MYLNGENALVVEQVICMMSALCNGNLIFSRSFARCMSWSSIYFTVNEMIEI